MAHLANQRKVCSHTSVFTPFIAGMLYGFRLVWQNSLTWFDR